MSTTSDAPFDQASGLRELFAAMGQAETPEPQWTPDPPAPTAPLPAVHALVCPSRPALSLPLAQVCNRMLRERGLHHAWVDEIDLNEREQWPLPCAVRYDLARSLANHVPLMAALYKQADGHSWYALSRRLFSQDVKPPALDERLAHSGMELGLVMLSAAPAQQRPWAVYGANVRPIVLIETHAEALDQAMDWMQAQGTVGAGLDVPRAGLVLVSEDASSANAAQARQTLDAHWQALFGHTPDWLGDVSLAPVEALLAATARLLPVAQRLCERLAA